MSTRMRTELTQRKLRTALPPLNPLTPNLLASVHGPLDMESEAGGIHRAADDHSRRAGVRWGLTDDPALRGFVIATALCYDREI